MKVLIIGFGNMGARHLQSILSEFKKVEAHVLELNRTVFLNNLKIIKVNQKKVIHHKDFNTIPKKMDFCVVATPSEPRFDIVNKLLEFEIDKFLLEKVVFQNDFQFENILNKIENSNKQIYCNFVSRYYKNFVELKQSLKAKKITMVVNGDDFGFACNSLHFIDLFEYFTNSKSIITNSVLLKDQRGNKRGENYVELNGELIAVTNKGDNLFIKNDVTKSEGLDLLIVTNDNLHVFKYKNKKHKKINVNDVEEFDFEIKYTSELTAEIYKDILNNNCLLPTLKQTRSAHSQFFGIINDALNLKQTDKCPIT